jgi:hypothetical protein
MQACIEHSNEQNIATLKQLWYERKNVINNTKEKIRYNCENTEYKTCADDVNMGGFLSSGLLCCVMGKLVK